MRRKRTHESIVAEIATINPDIEIIDQCDGVMKPVLCRCKICGFDKYENGESWKVIPNNLLQGKGCPNCNNRLKRTHEDLINSIKIANPYIEVLGFCEGIQNKVPCKCKICGFDHYPDGTVWEPAINNLLKGKGCPNCRKSFGEKRIQMFLEENKIEFVPQKQFDDLLGVHGHNLSYDFYLPIYNLLIEYQGQFHDGTVVMQSNRKRKIQQEHDMRKAEYAKMNNIELLEIWYWDYKNIKSILKEKLLST